MARPRNLRPSATRLAADRDEPDRDREHDQRRPARRVARRGAQQHDDQRRCEERRRANASNAPADDDPDAARKARGPRRDCRSRLGARLVRGRAARARAPTPESAAKSWSPSSDGLRDPAGVWSRMPRAPTNCRTPTAVATQLQPTAPRPQMREVARVAQRAASTAGASSMYSSHFARRDGVRARRIGREADGAPATPQSTSRASAPSASQTRPRRARSSPSPAAPVAERRRRARRAPRGRRGTTSTGPTRDRAGSGGAEGGRAEPPRRRACPAPARARLRAGDGQRPHYTGRLRCASVSSGGVSRPPSGSTAPSLRHSRHDCRGTRAVEF